LSKTWSFLARSSSQKAAKQRVSDYAWWKKRLSNQQVTGKVSSTLLMLQTEGMALFSDNDFLK
jgi:hypothetical protein